MLHIPITYRTDHFWVTNRAQELSAFAKVLETPAKPVLAILGGAKVQSRFTNGLLKYG